MMFKLWQTESTPSWVLNYNSIELKKIVESFCDDHVIPCDLFKSLHTPEALLRYFNDKFPYFLYTDVMKFPQPVLAVIKYLADLGHGESLYELGQASQNCREITNAINYFTLALKAGKTDALYQLGCLHEDLANLYNKSTDAELAVSFFKQAFTIDNQICILSGLWLAKAYSIGFGVEKDENVVFSYNVKLADLFPLCSFHQNDGGTTNVKALYYLGKTYLKGTSYAPFSEQTACEYFRRAADATHLDEPKAFLACYELGLLAAKKCLYAYYPGANPTLRQYSIDIRSALFWMMKAGDKGRIWITSLYKTT